MKSAIQFSICVGLGFAFLFLVVRITLVSPKVASYWAKVESVGSVESALLDIHDERIELSVVDVMKVLDCIKASAPYSPNHPNSRADGTLTIFSDQGIIVFKVSDTRSQGVLLYPFSHGTWGWLYGVRRCDLLRRMIEAHKKSSPSSKSPVVG